MRTEFPATQSSPSSRWLWMRDCRMRAGTLPFRRRCEAGATTSWPRPHFDEGIS